MNKILDIPSEVKSLNEATQSALNTAGRLMCERLDGQAERYRQSYLSTGHMKDLLSWAGYANRADSARLTYNQWKRGEM